MIEIKGLIKRYQGFELKIDNLVIQPGDRIALVGNNGAGKTTLLQLLLDLIEADEGNVFIDDKDIVTYVEWKLNFTSYLDESFLIEFLTPKEYLELILEFYPDNLLHDPNLKAQFVNFFDFEEENGKLIRDLSRGNKCKIGILSTLVSNPKGVLLDEPFSSLDPSSRIQLIEILNTLFKDRTLILSSHDLSELLEVSNKVILLEKGRVKLIETINEEIASDLKNYFRDQVVK